MSKTHRLSSNNHSIQHDDIGVSELSHDGSFLEELDFVFLWCFGETLQCHIHWSSSLSLPHSLLHTAKLTRPKMASDSTTLQFSINFIALHSNPWSLTLLHFDECNVLPRLWAAHRSHFLVMLVLHRDSHCCKHFPPDSYKKQSKTSKQVKAYHYTCNCD